MLIMRRDSDKANRDGGAELHAQHAKLAHRCSGLSCRSSARSPGCASKCAFSRCEFSSSKRSSLARACVGAKSIKLVEW